MKTINEMLDKNYESIKKIRQLQESFESKRYWIISYLHGKASHLIEEIENKIKETYGFDYVRFSMNNDEYFFNVFQTGFFYFWKRKGSRLANAVIHKPPNR